MVTMEIWVWLTQSLIHTEGIVSDEAKNGESWTADF